MTDLEAKRAEFRKQKKRQKRQQLAGAAGILVVGLGAIVAITHWMNRSLPELDHDNHAVRVPSVLPLAELNNIGGNWVGLARPEWNGPGDPAIATRDCVAALKLIVAEVEADGTLLLLDPDGAPVVECAR